MNMKRNVLVSLLIVVLLLTGFAPLATEVEGESPDPRITVYVVPPITDVKILPTSSIAPSYISDEISIVASPGEYEPASFVVQATGEDITSLMVEATELVGPSGSIPSANVDIRVVKVWWQAGVEIWDMTHKQLTPELLLKDDSLVKVEGDDNYVRFTTDGEYHWISNPEPKLPYDYVVPILDFPVEDADTLQPVDVPVGTNKQFWVTIRIPEDAVAGVYTGTISLTALGISSQIQLQVEVLPIELAEPYLTYSIYYMPKLTYEGAISSDERNEEEMTNELRNMLEHGISNPTVRGFQDPAWAELESKVQRILELRQSVGISNTAIYFAFATINWWGTAWDQMKSRLESLKVACAPYGATELYWYGIDETPDPDAMRTGIQVAHEAGYKVFCALSTSNALKVADVLDLVIASWHLDPSLTTIYHGYDHEIFSYGNPQVGEERPETYRRNYGLLLWQNDYDGAMNFAYDWSAGHIWNDFDHSVHRDHNFVYPTISGVIDTIQWEGQREAVDDVRYLTTLLNVIEVANGEGKDTSEAENYLADLKNSDLTTKDLDTVRSEMIEHILYLLEQRTLAQFSATPTTGNKPLEVHFSDQSTGSITSWSWDFGDGATSTEQDPLHIYADARVYTVSLTVTDNLAGSSTETKAGYITVYNPGDANGDGSIDSLDITKLKRIIMGLDDPTPGADANGDGNVNALDITKIELIIMGAW